MNMKLLRSLQVFVRVADTGNMSAAAKSLHMTVSAISQQLRKLEQDIGLTLFNRNTRNLSLTEAGRIYYRTSLRLISVAEKAQHEIEQLQLTPSGTLRIIAPEGFGGGLLSKPLTHLTSEFPKIKVSLILTDEPRDIMASGADLALCFRSMSDADHTAHHLASWRRILCVSRLHQLARMDVQSPTQLEGHCHLTHKNLQHYNLENLNNAPYTLPPSRLVVNSMQALIQLTCDGIGYAVLPEPEVRHYLRDETLIPLLPDWKLPDYSVYAVTPKQEHIPVKTLAAVNCLHKWFSSI
ncbi:LysR family transcriptional regulator [Alteromonas aestuariivivens]|uniref:LysR family transcriptional regulator n=1 Tax=Alteromonas aestuariivivens TaxID=1938339 RepID=A0A3D8MA88_9ALTE|nr:LysR family transcriptional regulator [Alteromonas aestuariivivens]RDV26774.1 LysR family transcriptional regulator [Alteromonas aestuariivivens]